MFESYFNYVTEVSKTSLVVSFDLLFFAICIFLLGFLGFINSHDFLSILINIELIMIGINFFLVLLSLNWNDYNGQVYAIIFLALTAAETAVGLGILILLYKTKGSIQFTEFSNLRG